MTDCKTTYRPSGRVVIRKIGGDHLLVPVSGSAAGENVIFPANRTAVFVWERLTGGKTVVETARELAETFDVNFDTGLADCEEIAQAFVDQKLLEKMLNS